MKSIQKLSIAFIATIILGAGVTMAQPGFYRGGDFPDPEDRHERMIDRLAYELKLTDEQKAEITKIYASHDEEMQKLRDEEQKVLDEMRKKHEEKRAEVAENVKKSLTDEQKAKFDELTDRQEAYRFDGRRGDRDNRPGHGRGQRF